MVPHGCARDHPGSVGFWRRTTVFNGIITLTSIAFGIGAGAMLARITERKERSHAYWPEDSVCGDCRRPYDGAAHYFATGG